MEHLNPLKGDAPGHQLSAFYSNIKFWQLNSRRFASETVGFGTDHYQNVSHGFLESEDTFPSVPSVFFIGL